MQKRIFDIFFSVFILLLTAPILLLIALAIKATSPGPVFYRCIRLGRSGLPFTCWKFRSMHKDAEKKLKDLLASDPERKAEWETYWKLKSDPRVTWVGKLLRKTSLDEFPQFWNVLKGDLSVVGPRPVTLEEIQKYYGERASKILSIRPGITGIWQTSGRNLISFEERVQLEENYVDKHSFLLDLAIIAKTIPSLFYSKGAF